MNVAVRHLEVLGRWVNRQPPVVMLLVVLAIVWAKTPLSISAPDDSRLGAAYRLPEPLTYHSSEVLYVSLLRGLYHVGLGEYLTLLNGLLLIAFLLAVLYLVPRAFPDVGRGLGILVVGCTTSFLVYVPVGGSGMIKLLGGLLLVVGRNRVLGVLGLLLLVGGHLEQALVASAALLTLTLIPGFQWLRRRAVVALASSVIAVVLVQIWFAAYDVPSRADVLPFFLTTSLEAFFDDPTSRLWSLYCASWVVVVLGLLSFQRSSRLYGVSALILIPLATVLITADGALVAAGVTFPAFLALSLFLLTRPRLDKKLLPVISAVLLIVLVLSPMPQGSWGASGELVVENITSWLDSQFSIPTPKW